MRADEPAPQKKEVQMRLPRPGAEAAPQAEGSADLWVFGYGSLMWNPGFAFTERAEARLFGFHRALCIYSFRHRGTEARPGLVLGLDRGGSCHGVAFRIPPDEVAATHAYLTEREQMNRVYFERMQTIRLRDGRLVRALAYVADRRHRQYAGRLDPATILTLVRQGEGQSGRCRDYVLSTLNAIAGLGIADHGLAWLRPALAD